MTTPVRQTSFLLGCSRHIIRESGFSVVEIMVSLVVGLIVVAGVSQIYLGSKQSYRLNEAQSRMQEDGRFALDFLARNIRSAGFKSVPLPNQPEPFPANSPDSATVPKFQAGQAVSGLYGSSGTADSASAKVSVRFLGRSKGVSGLPVSTGGTVEKTVQDCLGGDVAAGVLGTNTFSVDTVNHELQCTAINGGGNPSTQPVISGFGNFLVLYGIDTDDDGRIARSVNRYVSAANVGANWLYVTSIKLSFELRSAEDNLATAPAAYTFNGANFTDRRLRNRFELTVSLRNVLP